MATLPLDVPREEALRRAAELMIDAWHSFDRARPGQPPIAPATQALLARPLPEDPTPVFRALEEATTVLDQSMAQSRPRYFGFIGASGLETAVLADALAASYDINMASTAAAADLVEAQALRWVGELVGWTGGQGAGGAFTSGGMISNLTALAAAREHAAPGSRTRGIRVRLALYCSAEAHSSLERAAELLGLGREAVRAVPIDARRRMDPGETARRIDADRAAGVTPVAVVATAGTTLTGAVDPIDALADVCEERGVWLHVDGAYGLPAAAARPTRHLFAGLDRADSAAVDGHKWLYLPKACGVLLVRHKGALTAAFGHEASYMLHEPDDADDPVDWTLEYSRPFRALKLWLAFRVHGAPAFRAAIERNLELAQLLAEEVRGHPDLELRAEPQLSIVPFARLPRDGTDPDVHNRRLARALRDDGRVFVTPALVDGRVCLRPCFVNYRTTEDDVRALVSVVDEVGSALE